MKKLLIGIFAAVAFLVGCSSNAGNEYVGKWVNVKSEKRTVEIERNGESFMIRNTEPSFWDGKIKTENIPAIFKDGTLQIQTGFGATIISIDKASGNLNVGGAEYKRVK